MKIKIRPNSFIIISLIPYFIIIFILSEMHAENLVYLIMGISLITSLFTWKIYELLLYDSSTTCAKYAGNLALKNNYSPCYPDGTYWNPDELKISEIYENYKPFCSDYPKENTMGFIFYTNKKGNFSRHVEFYDYTNRNEKVGIYKFWFSPYPLHDKNDHVNLEYVPLRKLKRKKFYALNKIK